MNFRVKVLKRERMIGTHINFDEPMITDLYSNLGFDFIWVDMEHTTIDPKSFYYHLIAGRSHNTPILVRVPVNDLTVTKKVLEMGPDAIVFPMVSDAKNAKRCIDWCLYPPYGKRGCGPKAAVNYGADDEEYFRQKGHIEKTARFVMIEQKTAVDEIEEIAKIPYLDGVVLGMFDLSGSINKLGDIYNEKNWEMAKKVCDVFKKYNKTVAVSLASYDVETMQKFLDLGVNLLSFGSDMDFILKGGKQVLANYGKLKK